MRKIKNTLDEINKLDTAEEKINLKTHSKRHYPKLNKGEKKTTAQNEQSLSKLQDNVKQPNIRVIGVLCLQK